MELVIGHDVSVQSRRSLRQGQREGDAASQGDLAQVPINGGCPRDAELLQHILGLLLNGRVDTCLLYTSVKISHAALSDMEQIYSYIADRLLEPDTAMGQYNRIAEAIQSLNILPERCALVESEPERCV